MRKSLLERFEEKVFLGSPDGCWYWIGALGCKNMDRARISVNGVNGMASRVSWELYKGEIPNGIHVLHHCDNPSCVNPDHLFLGTRLDNIMDMVKKRRHIHGENHPNTKISDSVAKEIYKLKGLHKAKDISMKYDVGIHVVYTIWSLRTFKHINLCE